MVNIWILASNADTNFNVFPVWIRLFAIRCLLEAKKSRRMCRGKTRREFGFIIGMGQESESEKRNGNMRKREKEE